jgi:hypothetical protein
MTVDDMVFRRSMTRLIPVGMKPRIIFSVMVHASIHHTNLQTGLHSTSQHGGVIRVLSIICCQWGRIQIERIMKEKRQQILLENMVTGKSTRASMAHHAVEGWDFLKLNKKIHTQQASRMLYV